MGESPFAPAADVLLLPGNGNGDPKSNYLHENIQVLTPELDYLYNNIHFSESVDLILT